MKKYKDWLLLLLWLCGAYYCINISRHTDDNTLKNISFALAILFIIAFIRRAVLTYKNKKIGKKLVAVFQKAVSFIIEVLLKIKENLHKNDGGKKLVLGGTDTVKTEFFSLLRKNRAAGIKMPRKKDLKTPEDKIRYEYIIHIKNRYGMRVDSTKTAKQLLLSENNPSSDALYSGYETARYGKPEA